jgi:16S rRNA (cytosine967-C5)-methyltransferase
LRTVKPATRAHGTIEHKRPSAPVTASLSDGNPPPSAVRPERGESSRELELPDQLPDSRAGRMAIEILDATQQAQAKSGYFAAMEQLGRRLRAARTLHSSERRFVGDALNDMVRGLRRLRSLCGGKRPTARQQYIVYLLDRQVDKVDGSLSELTAETLLVQLPRVLLHKAQDAGLVVPELLSRLAALHQRQAQLAELPQLSPSERISAIGDALSYPDWLVQLLVDDLGLLPALAVLQAQNLRAPLTVRANRLKCSVQQLAERLRGEGVGSQPSLLAPDALRLGTRINAYGLPSFTDGWFELQDEGSQLIAELCAPPPGATVVDACAGAGGKTLALGAMLGNKGRLIALDIDRDKLTELQKRIRRAGLTNVQTICTSLDGQPPPRGVHYAELPVGLLQRGAQRVLVDAPCSGLGVLRRHPEARWRLAPKDIEEVTAKQRAILAGSAQLVQPGGRLIYATCTIIRRENDEVVQDFLSKHPDFMAVPVKEILGSARAAQLGDGQYLRLLPTTIGEEGGPDGFFAAVFRRVGSVVE